MPAQPSIPSSAHLVVIGGGAAGFFCAVNAARMHPGLQVTILEKSNKLLAKVRISGGGRCNTTHALFDLPELVRKYPRGQHFIKKAFHWFSTQDTIDWFAERGVRLHTEADGRMFPETNQSQTIIQCLLREADNYRVRVLLQTEVTGILPGKEGRFRIQTSRDVNKQPEASLLQADYICVACGGLPKSTMFAWLQELGHSIEAPVPSLFTFNMPGHPITALMGLSVERATVKVTGTKLVESGPLLITHWGMSGPVILRLSAWGARILSEKQYAFGIQVNWLPDYREQDLRNDWVSYRDTYAGQKIGNRNPFGLPSRLWLFLLQLSEISPDTRWAEITAKSQNRLIGYLTAHPFDVKGKTTFKEEFVTCGGIRLTEVDPNTFQSRIVPGLFFAGEVLDVDGITGGFNFQHAWTSGWIAAKNIASR
ncbi:MAG: NAD(P)/FAD-dependent oxidoreductase [Bacteroidota bacterium]|nr:NAD(P)/FAD-dependent oxidoreductase [Bacteroidota bacterium]